MSAKRRTDHGGSVATFVLVGVILTAGLIGAVYYLKQHGDQVRRDQAIAAYDKDQAAKEPKVTEKPPVVVVKPEAADSPEATVETTDVAVGSVDLPVTGSSFSVMNLVAVFASTAAFVGYGESRRRLARYL